MIKIIEKNVENFVHFLNVKNLLSKTQSQKVIQENNWVWQPKKVKLKYDKYHL